MSDITHSAPYPPEYLVNVNVQKEAIIITCQACGAWESFGNGTMLDTITNACAMHREAHLLKIVNGWAKDG